MWKVKNMKLCYENEQLIIRPIEKEDFKDIHEYASNPNVKQYIGWPLMASEEETKDHVTLMMARNEAKSHVYGSVVEKSTNKVVGTVMIFGFDEEANHAEVGYVFGESCWGKGYGSQAVGVLCDFAFKELKLRKLFARIVEINVGSAKVLKKNNFILEGTLKEYYCIHGALLNCQWYSKRSEL